jgi:pimeloyl-ACP methyl ester carboxylesterase
MNARQMTFVWSDCVDFGARPYTLADMAADAVAVLDGHAISTAHVVAASLGGAIGQWPAAHRRPRTRPHPHREHDRADGRWRRARVGPRPGRSGT